MTATRRVRIARKAIEAQDVCSFELVAADGGSLPAFSAGAHVDVHLDGGLVRQYSLCNDPCETHRYLIAVLREPASRGGSAAMHGLREGQVLEISEPRNHFPLATSARRHLLFAGGIGITPILAMAERLAARGESFDAHYCARSVDRAAFVTRIGKSAFAWQFRIHLDDGPSEQRLDIGALVAGPQSDTHLYVCGPAGFMEAVLSAARKAGWPESALHREYFASVAAKSDGDDGFEVRIASSGASIRVASDQTVVAALAAAGLSVPVSCEQGVCGTCLTGVIDGIPDHRDMFLTEEERARGDRFTPCCSRAKSPCLVLDL